MADNAFGDFFLSEGDDELIDDDELLAAPVVVPGSPAAQPAAQTVPAPAAPTPAQAAPAAAPAPVAPAPSAPAPTITVPEVRPAVEVHRPSREERLAASLDALMENNQEILAAALVSLDGFTMAAALPEGMQDDRVGAMSAAILGLGERASAELGRGALTQVFIEGEGGYVMLIAAGDRAVLTCIADIEAKLGLVLYDMRDAAETIAEILG
jgi:predicted regulator of Ras-like GTPase activity (Roadblock/LC7/MglB family)